MGYDLFPLDTLIFKQAFLREAVSANISSSSARSATSRLDTFARGKTASGTSSQGMTAPDCRLPAWN